MSSPHLLRQTQVTHSKACLIKQYMHMDLRAICLGATLGSHRPSCLSPIVLKFIVSRFWALSCGYSQAESDTLLVTLLATFLVWLSPPGQARRVERFGEPPGGRLWP